MAFRRGVLLELGGFDEALDTGRPLPGGGDLDMYYRIFGLGTPWSTILRSWRSTNTDGPWPSCGDNTGPGAPVSWPTPASPI